MNLQRGTVNQKKSSSSAALFVALLFLFVSGKQFFYVHAQSEAIHAKAPSSILNVPEGVRVENEKLERAMSAVCFERKRDLLGSLPIDEMQVRAELPLDDPTAVKAIERARRLLPVARRLTLKSLRQLARDYNVDLKKSRAVASRIEAVNQIEPDIELRDNALVIPEEPRRIYFGTIFLASLQSDEGLISVLAHELTHSGDGDEGDLSALFQTLAERAASLTGMEISEPRAEELACDLIGAMAARLFVEAKPNKEPLSRRLARAVEHNCVERDETDEIHLSPRSTLRAVLALDQSLAHDVVASGFVGSPERTHHR